MSDNLNNSKIGRNQLVSNEGLYYVCYQLSKRGWNAMPTSRNARGIDVLIYNREGTKMHTIQVKALSDRSPAPFGSKLDNLIAEYVFIVNNLSKEPNLYIMDTQTARGLIHEGEKNGKKSYWFQPNDYEKFKDNWSIIGES
ncbi:hypothetical protein DMB44_04845 [Thermoplasma sp. Kam2015]|uniref:hypothetical protein n=1 Tax=Thermoplasma sp. Kam2015 TaxID=2094122 RepID=UPI000D9242ED|nr:hypothetical protein [Thermoplasma sp. Kam2015]PYB68275.1 hypothetical protein DMB44_04845 [Thermoplasma sp. Kam2015]